jgi:hypothetical protein
MSSSNEHYGSDYTSSDSYPGSPAYAANYPNADNAYQLGRHNPRVDRLAARQILAPMPGRNSPSLVHELPERNPTTGAYGDRMTTGNAREDTPLSYAPHWTPSLSQLAAAANYPSDQFPHSTPEQRMSYSNAAADLTNAKAEQTLVRTAYGTLAEVGQRFDPRDERSVYARDVSVGAAFDVMKSGPVFEREREKLTSEHNKVIARQAEQREREAEREREREKRRRTTRAAGTTSGRPSHTRKRDRDRSDSPRRGAPPAPGLQQSPSGGMVQ